jgi:hypothetical protein
LSGSFASSTWTAVSGSPVQGGGTFSEMGASVAMSRDGLRVGKIEIVLLKQFYN